MLHQKSRGIGIIFTRSPISLRAIIKPFGCCHRKNHLFIGIFKSYRLNQGDRRHDFAHGKSMYPYSLFFITVFWKREGKPFLNPVVSNDG